MRQNVPYPYLFQGTEVELRVYKDLPKEWENRITRLELHYAYTKLADVLNSLDYAKTLKSIRFSHVILEMGSSNGRLVLPLLSEFHLDMLYPELKIDDSRTLPQTISETTFKSFLFLKRITIPLIGYFRIFCL